MPARRAQPRTAAASVIPIRTATNKALKPIKVGELPRAIAITSNGQTAYVVNSSSGTVTPIRNATSTAGKPIKIGSVLGAIAITPAGKTAYVARDLSVGTGIRGGVVVPINLSQSSRSVRYVHAHPSANPALPVTPPRHRQRFCRSGEHKLLALDRIFWASGWR